MEYAESVEKNQGGWPDNHCVQTVIVFAENGMDMPQFPI
jgi:hypothetical protein